MSQVICVRSNVRFWKKSGANGILVNIMSMTTFKGNRCGAVDAYI